MKDPEEQLPTRMTIGEQTAASLSLTLAPEVGIVPATLPLRIGRFRVKKILGHGGFGLVYLAEDEQLQRLVAIKVPYVHRVASYADAEAYLAEARAVAKLNHPNIVTVYDASSTEDCACFIVSQFIDGVTLAQRIKDKRPNRIEAAELIATIADALHYAHRKGLVHRDVKPGNILIDANETPFVVDFGLALTQQNLGQGPKYAGTPSYMSPEQASGEGRQVDQRSDIFSLGVMLYELLVGCTPFKGATMAKLLEQVTSAEVLPPRQVDHSIPPELERICLKALAKRTSERYETARDMANDLRRHLEQGPASEKFALIVTVGLLQRLLDAGTAQVPGIILEIEEYRAKADPLLKVEFSRAAAGSRQKLHASMALLSVDPTQVDYLYERLLHAGPTELPLIGNALRGYRHVLTGRLWQVLENVLEVPDRRFRAACALATYDPGGDDSTDRRWQGVAAFVVAQLLAAVQSNPSHYTPLLETLRPVRAALLAPLAVAFRRSSSLKPSHESERAAERFFATNLLAEYAGEQPLVLADFLMDADDKQFAVLFPKVAAYRNATIAYFQEAITNTVGLQGTEDAKERFARRQANAAVALLRLGRPEPVWPLLKHEPDPRVRSYLIHRLGPMGTDVHSLIGQLQREPDVTIRRALVLSLGELGDEAWQGDERATVVATLQNIYATAVDPGLHGAADWLLRRWQQDAWVTSVNEAWAKDQEQTRNKLARIRQELLAQQGSANAQWYVNHQGQTMVVIAGPVEFMMGSPPTEAGRFETELPHRVRIGRSFALAAKAVTVEQFLRFRPSYDYFRQYAPSTDCPVHQTTWYMASEYCNWLSELEGIPRDQWCYEPNAQEQYSVGMRIRPGYLSLAGYRLPTEAEWEYACRAGAATSRYFGESDELLTKYGVRSSNLGRSWPVGSLKPNDLGLFDMLGNVWCWCQERHRDYPQTQIVDDVEDILEVSNDEAHVLRGGSFLNPAVALRCAYRFGNVPANRSAANGFRPARTIAASI